MHPVMLNIGVTIIVCIGFNVSIISPVIDLLWCHDIAIHIHWDNIDT